MKLTRLLLTAFVAGWLMSPVQANEGWQSREKSKISGDLKSSEAIERDLGWLQKTYTHYIFLKELAGLKNSSGAPLSVTEEEMLHVKGDVRYIEAVFKSLYPFYDTDQFWKRIAPAEIAQYGELKNIDRQYAEPPEYLVSLKELSVKALALAKEHFQVVAEGEEAPEKDF